MISLAPTIDRVKLTRCPYARAMHPLAAGSKVTFMAGGVSEALRAAEAGADIIIAQGTEGRPCRLAAEPAARSNGGRCRGSASRARRRRYRRWTRTCRGAYQPAVQAAFAEAVNKIQTAGARIIQVVLPPRDEILTAHAAIVLTQARNTYRFLTDEQFERVGPLVKRSLGLAATISRQAVEEANATACAATSAVDAILDAANTIVMPTLAFPPPRWDTCEVELAGCVLPIVPALTAETCLFNLTGHPAVAVPVSCPSPIPFSLQMVGGHRRDCDLIHMASSAQTAIRSLTTGWIRY
jgi:Asp-tRNA(Asn)/Glu-tRNA(Gln) amidotransferase A subunit family amidase